ncbi:putative uncharacterized protein C8orf89 homolog isoform X2 [Rhineura floridana]|uniref:putative uncharacterized protein C8orf89 homolog isoform X2 n=1 Tax=Rhineura floridana TaxID=261503 RepID=UPI002AC8620D|nr:putative uncharacterized protein C8orf89 homolog isoform X2 [Rhineura floridana]
MSRSQQRNRLEQRDLQVHDGKLPEISCIPECRPIASQPPKGQKLPILKSDQRLLGNKVSGKSFESRLFENSWKNAVIKTKRMKQEYISAYGLRDCDENAAMPSLAQAIPNTSPIAQKTQSATKPFPSSNDDPSLPHLYVLPSTSSQCVFESFYKSRYSHGGYKEKSGVYLENRPSEDIRDAWRSWRVRCCEVEEVQPVFQPNFISRRFQIQDWLPFHRSCQWSSSSISPAAV